MSGGIVQMPDKVYHSFRHSFKDLCRDADLGLDVLGRRCVSMVSDSLKLYFQAWEEKPGLILPPD